MLWLELDENYDKPISESTQLEIDINIASFMYSNGKEEPITWDSHFKGKEPFPDRDSITLIQAITLCTSLIDGMR